MSDFDLELFKKRLAETIAWCVPRFSMDDLENCLRTPPVYPKEIMEAHEYEEIGKFADSVFSKRAYAQSTDTVKNIQDRVKGGYLLFMHLNWASCEGTSPPETDGFIDKWDFPAWDTWVYFGSEKGLREEQYYLIAWIPPEIIHMVERAIYHNSLECIQWVGPSHHPYHPFSFIDLLRS